MAPTATITDVNMPQWDRVIEMYRATDDDGTPLHAVRQIMDECGISKSELYYILRRRGISPNRINEPTDSLDAATLQAQLLQAHRRIWELEALLREHEIPH